MNTHGSLSVSYIVNDFKQSGVMFSAGSQLVS